MANTAWILRDQDLWKPASTLHSLGAGSGHVSLRASALKKLFLNGLARGTIAEITGCRSCGRTSVCLYILAQATAGGEICAVVDLHDSFHPASAAAAGVRLERLLWVRCRGNPEHAVRAADLVLHAGGFGVVLLDLCEANARVLNRIPLSYWYRFRRAIEHTSTILLICAESAQAKSCSSNLELKTKAFYWSGKAPFLTLRGMKTSAISRKTSPALPESLFIQTVA